MTSSSAFLSEAQLAHVIDAANNLRPHFAAITGAGPLIGLWDHQEGVPGRGDVSLVPSSWFSIELQATTPLPEWDNQPVRSAQEEDADLGADGQVHWILRRQTEFHVVR